MSHRAVDLETLQNSLAEPLDDLDYRLLNEFQNNFPIVPRPYLELAQSLGITEDDVLARLELLQQAGLISRVGVVLRPRRFGVSTLAAMRVPPEQLETTAALVNGFHEVNHNYERENAFNLWFVITAASQSRLQDIFQEIEQKTGIKIYSMPMEEEYHINLGFNIDR